uniref:uncharacterized protein LOC101311349 isoform X1 n=1 Tax=Fragaria vesca subsp. vesca TaxID=101020 RepID=UPI0005C9CE97|nr:PREDICTED: uncharacterized protein LOC101311349 isoform X1 [Fragaria vesca subsp. vesca]
MQSFSYIPSWVSAIFTCMGGCLGSCSQPRFTVVDEPSNRLRIQGQPLRKNSISEDFWSTSTIDMDNSAILSQISITSNNPLDAHGASSTSNTSEFVNHGLLLWNQTRQQWVGNKKSQPRTQLREPTISWNATYDSLLSTNKRFQRPIPLPEMIDFLVDIWEQEGLYD